MIPLSTIERHGIRVYGVAKLQIALQCSLWKRESPC